MLNRGSEQRQKVEVQGDEDDAVCFGSLWLVLPNCISLKHNICVLSFLFNLFFKILSIFFFKNALNTYLKNLQRLEKVKDFKKLNNPKIKIIILIINYIKKDSGNTF